MPSLFSTRLGPLGSLWQQHRQSRLAIPALIVAGTVLLVMSFKLLQPAPPIKAKEEKSWVVQTITLQNGPKTPQLELYGKVESPYTSTLTSTVDADVASLEIREGERVTRGQTILVLDDSEVRLLLDQRQSDVADLEAQIESENTRHRNDLASLKLEKSLVELARKKLAREEKTSKANLTSQSSYDSQKQALQSQELALKARQLNVDSHPARLAQLQARLKQKRAQLEQAEKDLKRTEVAAPFDGIVLNTSVSPGERVRPGEVLVEIYATDEVELRAQLPQKHIDDVRRALAQGISMPAKAVTPVGDIEVHLHRISGAIGQTGTGVDALFEVAQGDSDKLVIGEVLDVIVDLPEIDNVYRVPVSALYGTDRIYRVSSAIADDNGTDDNGAADTRLETVRIEKLGNQVEGGQYYLLVRSDKLDDGDRIITTQLPHAVSGLKVIVRDSQTDDRQ
jgi:multidrug efflux pump subunit AcrA (membrane-fusion protein)